MSERRLEQLNISGTAGVTSHGGSALTYQDVSEIMPSEKEIK